MNLISFGLWDKSGVQSSPGFSLMSLVMHFYMFHIVFNIKTNSNSRSWSDFIHWITYFCSLQNSTSPSEGTVWNDTSTVNWCNTADCFSFIKVFCLLHISVNKWGNRVPPDQQNIFNSLLNRTFTALLKLHQIYPTTPGCYRCNHEAGLCNLLRDWNRRNLRTQYSSTG